jgi:hypothetical protein
MISMFGVSRKEGKAELHAQNPVVRGLVAEPQLWIWSSDRFYRHREKGICTPDLILDEVQS